MKISRILVFSVLRDLGIQSNWDRKRCKKAFGLSIPLREIFWSTLWRSAWSLSKAKPKSFHERPPTAPFPSHRAENFRFWAAQERRRSVDMISRKLKELWEKENMRLMNNEFTSILLYNPSSFNRLQRVRN